MNRTLLVTAALVASLAAGAGAGYWYAVHNHSAPPPPAKAVGNAKSERRVLYWYDPMSPQQRFDKPGKSPFMDMQLVPKYADESEDQGGVTVAPRVMQNLGVRTAEVTRGSLATKLTAVGSIEYNERAFVVVQPRANGYIERLFVRAALDSVRQGDPLVEILFPDWASAQEEYLLLRKRNDTDLAAAARQRLVLLGMSEEQIAGVERAGTSQPRVTLRAPVSGVIAELGARQGMTVNAGATLFRIASLGAVWMLAEVPEAQAAAVSPGSRVEIHAPAYPGERFAGRVDAVLPEINQTTRTLRTRIEVANTGGRLKPGMYANVDFTPRAREVLLVPSEAVIRTGTRDVVIVAEAEGRFRPVEVQIGTETGGNTEVLKGLTAGNRVVVSGQFLIDSEASLRTTLDRLQGAPASDNVPGTGAVTHRGRGKIVAIDAAQHRIELEHGPIATLNWPPMTMGFPVADTKSLATLRTGEMVDFELRGEPDKNGEYVIVAVAPAGAPK
ncbi:MAG: efflux RND transporter periplasmic adaptor subunit [Burkholderiales bacterium]